MITILPLEMTVKDNKNQNRKYLAINEVSILRDTLRRYGLLDSDEMYDDWIKNRLSKVDKQYPLIDERND